MTDATTWEMVIVLVNVAVDVIVVVVVEEDCCATASRGRRTREVIVGRCIVNVCYRSQKKWLCMKCGGYLTKIWPEDL